MMVFRPSSHFGFQVGFNVEGLRCRAADLANVIHSSCSTKALIDIRAANRI